MIKVLIIDDEPDILELLNFTLSVAGEFTVETAPDGEAGLEKAYAFNPDVVLADLLMPGMDGWEFCRRLRADPTRRGLPVVLMTAAEIKDLAQRSAMIGARSVLHKPFEDRRLAEILRQAVGR